MKQFFFLLLCIVVISAPLYAQSTDTVIVNTDSLKPRLLSDSLELSRVTDTLVKVVSIRPVFKLKNLLLNSDATPVSFSVQFKKVPDKDSIFYLIAGIVLLLAFFKYLYSRYFTNLIRVFFNTSLRQSQLTDQLLQAKLPSLLYNLFFIISGGIFICLLLAYFHWSGNQNYWIIMVSCIGVLGLIYLLKFSLLKFTGWITGYREQTDAYIFIFFLMNKMIGIFLVPFIFFMAFAGQSLINIAVQASFIMLGLMLALRFFRSYGLLQNQLKISRFHFLIYIIGIEILPLLLIYKGLLILLNKNL